MERDMPLFIWVNDLKPMAQIIRAEVLTGTGVSKLTCIQQHKITEEEANLGVALLSRIYPLKEDV